MNKKFRAACSLILACGILLGALSGCSIVGTTNEETTAYIESVSKAVKEPSVSVEKSSGEKLVIEDGVKEITAEMLNGKNLISIDIPDSVKNIEEGSIDKNTVIICNDNTYASDYASENGYWYYLTYQTLDENNDKVTLEALYSNENVMITDAMPCNSVGILHTLDGEIKRQDSKTIIDYVDGLFSEIKAGKPYIGYSRNYGIDDLELTAADESKSDIGLLNSAKGSLRKLFLDNAKNDTFMPVPEAVEYGVDNSASFTVGNMPYSDAYDKDETFSAYCVENDVINKITVNFGDVNDSALLDAVFGCIPAHSRDEINAEFDKLSAYVDIADDWTVEFKNCRLYAMADRTTDHAEKIELTKVAYVTATAKGVGEFESLGEFTITFRFNDVFTISCDWTEPVE